VTKVRTSAIPEYPSSPVCPLVHALTSITTPSWRPHHHRCRSCRWTDSDQSPVHPESLRAVISSRGSDGSQIAAGLHSCKSEPDGSRRTSHRLTSHHITSHPSHAITHITSHHTHHITSQHITPHHIAAPQREFGCRIPPSGTCTLPGLAGQSTNTNTNTIPNDGMIFWQKCRRKSHQRRTVLLTVRLVLSVPTMIGSSTRAH
jgi:hypothetical protein